MLSFPTFPTFIPLQFLPSLLVLFPQSSSKTSLSSLIYEVLELLLFTPAINCLLPMASLSNSGAIFPVLKWWSCMEFVHMLFPVPVWPRGLSRTSLSQLHFLLSHVPWPRMSWLAMSSSYFFIFPLSFSMPPSTMQTLIFISIRNIVVKFS